MKQVKFSQVADYSAKAIRWSGVSMLFALISIFCMSMSLAAEPDSTGTFNIKGDMIGCTEIDIYVFVLDEETCGWERIDVKYDKDSYKLQLDTDKEYQIWFMSQYTNKIMYVRASDSPSDYYFALDVDFRTSKACVIYKDPYDTRYYLETLDYEDVKSMCFYNE